MKLKKTIITMLVVLGITVSPTLTYAGTYATRGLWIGAASGSVLGAVYYNASYDSRCGEPALVNCADGKTGETVGGFFIGGLVGGLVGLGIGALIPKEPKVSIVPVISGTPDEFSAGFNLSTRF